MADMCLISVEVEAVGTGPHLTTETRGAATRTAARARPASGPGGGACSPTISVIAPSFAALPLARRAPPAQRRG